MLVIDIAVGGNGGNVNDTAGVGFGHGGNGGTASSSASGSTAGVSNDLDIRSTETGGGGGAGFGPGGNGGNGAAINRTNEIDGTGQRVFLYQVANGGFGGGTTGGNTGTAGAASSSLTRSKNIGLLQQSVEATGGAGGRRDATSGTAGAGATGTTISNATNAGGGANSYTIARGGEGGVGGTANAAAVGASGGVGGAANATASGTTQSAGQPVDARGTAVGGKGGDAFSAAGGPTAGIGGNGTSSSTGTANGASNVLVVDIAVGGNGGNGAAIARTDEIDGTGQQLSLVQAATGGNGGETTGGNVGTAGTAYSSLIRSKNIPFLQQFVEATGGAGGRRNATSGTAGAGANATTVSIATNSGGGVNNYPTAKGGTGGFGGTTDAATGGSNGGVGGIGTNTATGTTQSAGQNVDVRGTANGGNGGDAFSAADGPTAGAGGNGTSSSTGTANGASNVLVIDTANGGAGGNINGSLGFFGHGGLGGNAASTAVGTGVANLDVRSTATAGTGGSGFGGGGTVGLGGSAIADATSTGGSSGQATSSAVTRSGIIKNLIANTNAPLRQTSHAQSRAAVGVAAPALALASGLEAASFVTGSPINADVLGALAGDNRVSRTFNIAGENPGALSSVYGLTTLSGGYGGSVAGSSAIYTSSATYAVDLSTTTLDRLVVGMLDPVQTGVLENIRFRISVESTNVLDYNIHPDLGFAYFDNQVIDLGNYADVTGDLDITFTLDVTASQVGAEFSSQFIFGNTNLLPPLVPEADFDSSTQVLNPDLTLWKANYGDLRATHPEGDANYDNIVDGSDFLIWQRQLGQTFPPSTLASSSVPESASAALALTAIGAALLLRWRR